MRFVAEAPGKIILTGEHFVVHGSYALAAAIGKRTRAEASLAEGVRVVSRDLGLTALPPQVPSRLRPIVEAVKATQAFLEERRGVEITIESRIPPSSGLGSSSAAAVASVAAASSALGHTLTSEEIFRLAMVSERLVHGKPSGIDVAVAVYGGVILFRRDSEVEKLKLEVPVEFVVASSGVERNTSELIAVFTRRRARTPHLFDGLVHSSSLLSRLAASHLQNHNLKGLGALLNFYHATLGWLGVSSQGVDRMVDEAMDAGALGAKLTGGGGGGCIIALPQPDRSQSLVERFKALGYEAFIVRLPEEGLKLWGLTDR